MKNRLLLIGIILLHVLYVTCGNELYYQNYQWEDFDFADALEAKEEKVVLLKEEAIEFAFEDSYLLEYYLLHQVEYINSDEQVERNNKKYIPYDNDEEVIEAKARVIKGESEINELDKSKILTSYDERTGENYMYFALEGLEKGNIVDLFYVIKKSPSYNGMYRIIQGEHRVSDYIFKLFSPTNLIFDFKILNDSAKIIQDTSYMDKNHWMLHLDSIPALKKEENAPYNLLLKQVLYRLDKNIASENENISSYGKASQNLYSNIYKTVDKADKKALKKFNRGIKFKKNALMDDKIYTIEKYIKQNINILDYSNGENSKISDILSHKNASKYGITTLFANILKLNEIEHQIVLTCNRNKARFDPEFESFHFLSRYLIYFPKTHKFLSPDQFAFRYDLIPEELTDNYGLFIKEIVMDKYKTGIGLVNYIPALDYEKSYYNHDVKAIIKEDFSNVDLDISMKSSGYYAIYLHPYLELFSEDIVERIVNETFNNYIPHLNLTEWNFENEGVENVGREPLIINGKAFTGELVDIAGDRFLFKLGDLIGPQVEMYSQKERDLPVYDDYKRSFNRNLMIEIPSGYTVKNPDDIIIYAEYINDGKRVLLFESDYTIEGQTLTVRIQEYYDQLYYRLDEYPIYRTIVNSASDFNKVVLVFEKNK